MLRCLQSSNFESRTERELRNTRVSKRPQQYWQDRSERPNTTQTKLAKNHDQSTDRREVNRASCLVLVKCCLLSLARPSGELDCPRTVLPKKKGATQNIRPYSRELGMAWHGIIPDQRRKGTKARLGHGRCLYNNPIWFDLDIPDTNENENERQTRRRPFDVSAQFMEDPYRPHTVSQFSEPMNGRLGGTDVGLCV